MIATALLAILVQMPQLPTLSEVRHLYEAGMYQETIEAAGRYRAAAARASIDLAADLTWPRLLFLAAGSHRKLDQAEAATNDYQGLAGWPETSPWHFIGYSAKCLIDKQCIPPAAPQGAEPQAKAPLDPIQAAQRAATLGATLPEASYQLGLAYSFKERFAEAAQAFDRAAQLDPTLAYARYYAGICYYKVKRVDLTANRFEAFLKLAPDAPERPEVLSIMRTLRGRR